MDQVDIFADPDQFKLSRLIAGFHREADELGALLTTAIDAQWSPAPVERPRVDTAERMKERVADPTAAIALDTDRFALRTQVVRSVRILHNATAALRGVRGELECALAPWHGEGQAGE